MDDASQDVIITSHDQLKSLLLEGVDTPLDGVLRHLKQGGVGV